MTLPLTQQTIDEAKAVLAVIRSDPEMTQQADELAAKIESMTTELAARAAAAPGKALWEYNRQEREAYLEAGGQLR